MALDIHRNRVRIHPKTMDPRMVKTRDVSNLHARNLIMTGAALEFWIAKIATPMRMRKAIQEKIRMGSTSIHP